MSFDMDQKNWDKIHLKTRTKSTVKLGQKLHTVKLRQIHIYTGTKSAVELGQNPQLIYS